MLGFVPTKCEYFSYGVVDKIDLPEHDVTALDKDNLDYTSGYVRSEGAEVLRSYIEQSMYKLMPEKPVSRYSRWDYVVYELGCGSGLCALFWGTKTSRKPFHVVFQDLNPNVLRERTMVAMERNLKATGLANVDVTYVSCSWAEIVKRKEHSVEGLASDDTCGSKEGTRKTPNGHKTPIGHKARNGDKTGSGLHKNVDKFRESAKIARRHSDCTRGYRFNVETEFPIVSSSVGPLEAVILCADCVYSPLNFADLASVLHLMLSKFGNQSYALISGKQRTGDTQEGVGDTHEDVVGTQGGVCNTQGGVERFEAFLKDKWNGILVATVVSTEYCAYPDYYLILCVKKC